MTTSDEVPGRLPVAIDGHPYAIDPAEFQRSSLPVLRQQSDQSNELGEQSLNPRGLWRRSQDSWHHGAGQDFFDAKIGGTVADSERFDISTGTDIWTKGEITTLPAVVRVRSSGTFVIAVGNYAYVIDSQQVYWASSPTTSSAWTSANIHGADAATTVRSITSDGQYIWAAVGTSGIHRTIRGEATSTANVPAAPAGGNVGLVGFALGRLLAAGSDVHTSNRNVLWEVTSPLGGTPALAPNTGTAGLYFSHPNTTFIWEGISPGRNCIYAFGNVPSGPIDLNLSLEYGGRGEVYRIGLNPTDTSLTAPTVATYLPDGESIHALTFYAGGIVMGTSRGFRLGVADAQGNIDYGPLVETLYPVCALEPQGGFCWFGMPQQAWAASGAGTAPRGLGRMDLGTATDTLIPAWSQDLQSTNSDLGNITSIASLAGGGGANIRNLVFAINSGGFSNDPRGIYRVNTLVSTGWNAMELRTGRITFSTAETKTLVSFTIEHDPLPVNGLIDAYYRVNGTTSFTSTPGQANTTAGSTETSFTFGDAWTTGLPGVESVEFIVQAINMDATVPIKITRWTLKALPTPQRNETFLLPLLMYSSVETLAGDGQPQAQDVDAEISFLKGLERAGTIVEFQVGNETLSGYIEESRFTGDKFSPTPSRHPEGVYTVQITTVVG